MRWETRDTRSTTPLWVWMLAPIWGLPLLLLVGILATHNLKRRLLGPGTEWSRWFAWHPVGVGYRRWAWLEYVERRASTTAADIECRAPEETEDD